MKRSIFLAAAAAACLAIPAAAQQRTEIGLLDCTIEGGAGFIVGSQKDLTCTFTPADGSQPAEAYVGTVTKFGLDVGVTGATLMRWLVVAPTGTRSRPGRWPATMSVRAPRRRRPSVPAPTSWSEARTRP